MRRPSPHPPIVPIISAATGRPTLRPPTMPVISTSVGRRFFPPSLPRRCRPTQWRNRSSIDRASPVVPNSSVATQLLKLWKFNTSITLNLPVFSGFKTLALFAQFPANAPRVINNLQPLFSSFSSLFAPPIFCFQRVVDSFLQNRGVGGSGAEKSKTNRVKDCQQAATLGAS